MIVSELIDKMSREGDPLLRFRVLNELSEDKTSELGTLKREVEASDIYGLWLDRLPCGLAGYRKLLAGNSFAMRCRV